MLTNINSLRNKFELLKTYKRTCYKSPTSPSCVALIIKSKPRSFQNSCTIDTRLLHFHEMTPKVLKSSFAKQKPRVHKHCSYEVFKNTLLRNWVLNGPSDSNLQISDKDLKQFKETCLSVLNTFSPLKFRYPL